MWPHKPASTSEIPLFPLPEVVLFPGCLLPLHIFEMRYREMVNQVVDGEPIFGVLNLDPNSRQPAEVGCSAEILEVQKIPDGRMNILTVGRQRFRVREIKEEKSYLTGIVEWLDDHDPGVDLGPMASEMRQLLKDVVRLSAKLADKQVEFPDDLPTAPMELSFWVAGSFPGLPDEQQALLEMRNTAERLQRETEILTSACKQLAARTALKDAFG
jgi:ATP-dependent Lon protease